MGAEEVIQSPLGLALHLQKKNVTKALLASGASVTIPMIEMALKANDYNEALELLEKLPAMPSYFNDISNITCSDCLISLLMKSVRGLLITGKKDDEAVAFKLLNGMLNHGFDVKNAWYLGSESTKYEAVGPDRWLARGNGESLKKECIPLIEFFIKRGSNPNQELKGYNGATWTPLTLAISSLQSPPYKDQGQAANVTPLVNLLIQLGASPNIIIKEKAGRNDPLQFYTKTPLYIAIEKGSLEIVKKLVDIGADITFLAQPEAGVGQISPIAYATLKSRKNAQIYGPIAEYLLRYALDHNITPPAQEDVANKEAMSDEDYKKALHKSAQDVANSLTTLVSAATPK